MIQESLVSIILPTHNRAGHLKKAIESVLSQTHTSLELIVVNDASRDETSKIIFRYQRDDERVREIRNTSNLGFVASLNRGIQDSRGIYIARLDDDDTWCDHMKLEKQIGFLDIHFDYVLVGGGVVRVDEGGKEITRELFPETDPEIRNSMLVADPIVHTAVVFRKSAWKEVGGYDEQLDFSQDWDLWMKLAKTGKLYNFPEYFVHYLRGKQNRSNKNLRHHLWLNIVVRYRHRDTFPNFWKGYILGWVSYFFAFIPFWLRFHPIFLKIKNSIVR